MYRLRYLESLLASTRATGIGTSPQDLLEFCICTAHGLTPHGHLMFAVFKSWLVVTQKQVCWNE